MNFDFLKKIDDEVFLEECKDLYELCCASELTVHSQPTASLGNCRSACERIMRFYYLKNDGHNSKVAEKIGTMQKSSNVIDAFKSAILEELQKKEDIINEREKNNKNRVPKSEEEIKDESFKLYAVLDDKISSIKDSGNDAVHTGKIDNVELLARENLKALFIVISSILKYSNLISENDIPQYIEPMNDTINKDLDLGIEVPDEYNFEKAIIQETEDGLTKLSFADSKKYYIGKVKNKKPHGNGLFYFSEDSVYDGEWKNGVPNGHGKRTYDNGKIYDGEWKEGKRNGHGIYITYRGNDGKGATIFSNWKDDNMDDEKGEIIFEDGKKYIGGLKGKRQDGKGCFYREDGSIYLETQYISGTAFGFTKFYYSNGQIEIKGNLKEGKWEGLRTDFYENGSVRFEGSYKADKITGIGKKYFENGNLMEEGEYENNLLNGEGKTYYRDGYLEYEGGFKNGERNGFGKKYNKEGVIIYEGNYKDGKADGEGKTFYADGTLWYEGTRLGGYFDGNGREYYKNGQLKYEGIFKNGHKNGKGVLYNEAGWKEYEGEFKNDLKNGFGKTYSESGLLLYNGQFANGQLIGNGTNNRENVFIKKCPVSFNRLPNRDYIVAKETNPNLSYKAGPIVIDEEKSFWILTMVCNDSPDEKEIAKDVHLSIQFERISDKEILVKSTIRCSNAEPQETMHTIHFLCDEAFDLEYVKGSAFLYSEFFGGLNSELGYLKLSNDILTHQGALLGYKKIDGNIRGGIGNQVSVSIQVNVIRRRFQFNNVPGKKYILAKETRTISNQSSNYRKGPIKIVKDETFWILSIIDNDTKCDREYENLITEDVRLAMKINRLSSKEAIIESNILCSEGIPKKSTHEIHFVSDYPFEISYIPGSACMYSEYYGLHGSRYIPLGDGILSDSGVLVGFWDSDGKIPCGEDNEVSVSIKVNVKIIASNLVEN